MSSPVWGWMEHMGDLQVGLHGDTHAVPMRAGTFSRQGQYFPSCHHLHSPQFRSVWVSQKRERCKGGRIDGWMHGCHFYHPLISLSALKAWIAQVGQNSVLRGSSDTACLPVARTRPWGMGKGGPPPSPGCAHTVLAGSSIMPFPASCSCHSTSC